MKFTTAFLTASAAMASIVSASPTNLEKRQTAVWRLTASATGEAGNIPLTTVVLGISYLDRGLYFGDIQYSNSVTEPARLLGGNGGFSFLSYHSSPTGYQRLFAYPEESQALGFTIPHSSAVPAGATTEGFTGSSAGSILFGETLVFKACPVDGVANSYQVFFEGGEPLEGCTSITLSYHFE